MATKLLAIDCLHLFSLFAQMVLCKKFPFWQEKVFHSIFADFEYISWWVKCNKIIINLQLCSDFKIHFPNYKKGIEFYSHHYDLCLIVFLFSSVSSVAQSCLTLCNPMNCSTPGLPVHHQLLEFTQTHVHRVSDAIQPSYPLSSPSPPAFNLSQHQGLFQWVNSSHEVAKVLEFQL